MLIFADVDFFTRHLAPFRDSLKLTFAISIYVYISLDRNGHTALLCWLSKWNDWRSSEDIKQEYSQGSNICESRIHLSHSATMSLGLLLFVLGLMVQTQAMIINESQKFKEYEVVYPQKLHIIQEREIQGNPTESNGKKEKYEPEVQYQITINGENVVFQLNQNNDLTSKGYTETYYSSDEKKITSSPRTMGNCYYHGHIQNEKDSIASFSLCRGLRGFFKYRNQTYLIEPLKDSDLGAHVILKYEDPNLANQTFGEDNSNQKHILTRNPRAVSDPNNFLTSPKYISLFLVLDKAFYDIHKGNQTSIRNFLFNVINLLNVIYNTLDVHVALVGLEIWSDTNKINVVPEVRTTFSRFLNWRNRQNQKKWKKYDHVQLLSGIGFRDKQVGLAASNSMCSSSSISVIEAWRKNSVSLAGVMSHELGHVLGMADVHFKTICPSGSCVMNQYLTSKFPKDFSESSHKHFKNYLLSQKPMCLLQAPAPEDIITNPVCGNKLQEVGEDCDCGTLKECTNPCCDAKSCRWKPEAQCEGGIARHARRRN
ncbi:ADAM DEC1 [Monodelphis domestica]|nr:ADAM DEC1 [Monodelphis domestica]